MGFPLINGDFYSFQDIGCGPTGLTLVGWKKVDYDDELSRSWVRGTARTPLGRTCGHYTPNMEVEQYVNGFNLLYAIYAAAGIFSGGAGRVALDWTISYGGTGPFGISVPVMTDTIPGCVITKIGNAHSEREDAVSRTIKLMPGAPINWAGVGPLVLEPGIAFALG